MKCGYLLVAQREKFSGELCDIWFLYVSSHLVLSTGFKKVPDILLAPLQDTDILRSAQKVSVLFCCIKDLLLWTTGR